MTFAPASRQRLVLSLAAASLAAVICNSACRAQEAVPRPAIQGKADLELEVGRSYTLAGNDIFRVAIGDSAILDAKPISSAAVEVQAKSPGISSLYIWDTGGLRETKVRVLPSQADLAELASRITLEIGLDTVRARVINGALVLDGVVAKTEDLNRAKLIANALYPDTLNLVKVDPSALASTLEALRGALASTNLSVDRAPDGTFLVQGSVRNAEEIERVGGILSPWKKQNVAIAESISVAPRPAEQVLIRARVLEVSRQDLENIGVDWGKIKYEQGAGGQLTYTAEDQPWIIGQPRPGPFPLFGGPALDRLDPIGARINALVQANKARVLSEPNVLVADGKEASILVGGEIPVPIVQSVAGGTSSISIEWKAFGVNLKVTPNVGEDGKTLFLKVQPEVSSLDFANAVVISGFTLPALRTRRAETSVQIQDGQSLVIGGLVQTETSKNVRKIPILGDVPIIGALFRTKSTTQTETELVILITPEIVKQAAVEG